MNKSGGCVPVKCRACGWRGDEDELWADDEGNEQCPSCLTAGLIEDAEDEECRFPN